MNINTKDRSTKIRYRFLAIAFLTIGLLAFLLLSDFVKQREAPIGVIILAVIIYLYYMFKRYMYFSFDDESEKISIRYFNLIPTAMDHHAIEIPKRSLVNYEIKKSFFGLREEIILVQKLKNGIAKYPPISISILNDIEKRALSNSLSSLSIKNK